MENLKQHLESIKDDGEKYFEACRKIYEEARGTLFYQLIELMVETVEQEIVDRIRACATSEASMLLTGRLQGLALLKSRLFGTFVQETHDD